MKPKHIKARILQCLAIADCSNCPRAKHGCVIVEPNLNVVLVDSYNNPQRGGPELCGGQTCLRDSLHLRSGELTQIGCNHAEFNACGNAARLGIKLEGSWAFITGEPCLMCSKILYHSGIKKVIIIKGGYSSDDGPKYLRENGIEVEYVERESVKSDIPKVPTLSLQEYKNKWLKEISEESLKYHSLETKKFIKVGQGITELQGDFE